jgi:fatty acid desaturase
MMFAIYCLSYVCIFTSVLDSTLLPAVGSANYTLAWWAQRGFFSVILGWAQMMLLLHVMHDCSHSAVGHSEAWWKVGGRIFSETFIGSSMVAWQNQHVVGHHIYTSVYSLDPDVPVAADGDIRLIVPQQRTSAMYKYQHIYLCFLYCLLAFKSRFQDITIYLSRKNGPIDVNPVTGTQWLRLVGSKLIHVLVRIVIPLMLVLTPTQLAVLYFLSEFVGGGYLAFNFQVSHVSDAAEVPVARAIPASQSFPVNHGVIAHKDAGHVDTYNVDRNKLDAANAAKSNTVCRDLQGVSEAEPEELLWDMEWAHLQVLTSVDYAHNSPLCTFMCGALNYQTVHHLFPSVSQYLYPYIADIVKQTCKDFGVKYNYIPTFAGALQGHINYLQKMGNRGIPVEAPKME